MKHYNIKTQIAGAGGGSPKPKPAQLKPPKLGDYRSASSYSYAEILDLVSDGPVEGLVNKNGYTLPANGLLQGIYLNNVPVEETNQSFLLDEGKEIEFGDQSNFENGMKDLFIDIGLARRDETIPFPYPDTSNLFQYKQINYSFNNLTGQGGFKDSTLKNSIQDLSLFENYTTVFDEEAESKYSYKTYGPTFSGQDNTPIRGVSFSSGNYDVEFCLGVKHVDDVFSSSTIAGKNVEDFLYAVKSGNLYQSEWTKNKLLNYGFSTGQLESAAKEDIKDLFSNYLSPEIDGWFLDPSEYIDPYVCISVNGVMDGYDFYNHVNFFLAKDDADNLTTTLNYETDFALSSIQSLEGLKLPQNTISFLFPDLKEDGTWDGKVKGFYFFRLDVDHVNYFNITPEVEEGLLNPGYIPPTEYDVLISAQDQKELNYLIDLKGFVLIDKSVSTQQEDSLIQSYYEGYVFERQLIDTGGCNLETTLARERVDSGYSSDDSVQIINNRTLFSQNTIRKGIQLKYTFQVLNTDETDTISIHTDALIPSGLPAGTTYYRRADGYINGVLINSTSSTFTTGGAPRLDIDIGPSSLSQTVTIDFIVYADLATPVSCPFSLTSMGEFRAVIIRPSNFLYDYEQKIASSSSSPKNNVRKFNWSNVFAEFRNGSQKQLPLNYFKDIQTDFNYSYSLLGPFSVSGREVQRIEQGDGSLKKNGTYPKATFASERVPRMDEDYLFAREEGSNDFRGTTKKDYSTWNELDQDYEEDAQPLMHIIENPNVDSVWFTLMIEILKDTVEQSVGDPEEPTLDAGAGLPAILNIRVETGLIDNTGKTITTYSKLMQITALVESSALLDIGNKENKESPKYFDYINEFDDIGDNKGGMFNEFQLEPAQKATITDLDTSAAEHRKERRFIRITKLSTETQSTLIYRECGVLKVTEITKGQLSYPHSAYNGIKIDARVFSEIPKRAFDIKLKKVKIPTNYTPTFRNGKDKRYISDAVEFSTRTEEGRSIYKGDWDGSFKYGWTDNPAWILYDMITNERYGLGGYIEESSVNKWDLYKIGKFCDAVDDNGYFVGLPDGKGGLEPRFSCNIIFSEETKVFDAINTIANIFRGVVYYNNSTIEFSDDRPKEPVALFTNVNVKEGVFTYSNYKRDEQINTIEVVYIDKDDDWKSKIELVENQDDIANRGIFKKTINAYGITSKSMARRAGEHVLYQTTKENQNVAFTCGMESLLCKPGDLILIDDDLKSFTSNYGRVLNVDDEKKSIRISNPFVSDKHDQEITLYKPSEITDIETIEDVVSLNKQRLENFTILSNDADLASKTGWAYMIGRWDFAEYGSGYSKIFNTDGSYISPRQEEYAIYKNESPSFVDPLGVSTLWFNTQVTGWVFSTGDYKNNENNNLFILEPDLFDFNDLQFFDVNNLSQTSLKYYDSGSNDKRGAFVGYFTGGFLYNDPSVDLVYYKGNPADDTLIGSNIQIFSVPTTGYNDLEYGGEVYVDKDDINSSLLKFVPPGTPYRFQIKNEKKTVYKVNSIKEEDKNEYSIIAQIFDTGKYDQIEYGSF